MPVSREGIARELEGVRARTLDLFDAIDPEVAHRPPSAIMSPPVWDLGHIAAYEELWLVRRLGGGEARHPELDDVYDAFETPRAVRGDIDILDEEACRRFLDHVRARALDVLERADVGPDADPLTADGFVFAMVAQHEAQHTETLLQGLKMLPRGGYAPPRREPSIRDGRPDVGRPAAITIPAGTHVVGATEPDALDVERPAHEVELAEFRIAARPVVNGEWLEFVADGGYDDPRLWSEEGWSWRAEERPAAPAYWEPDGGGGWLERDFDRLEPVDRARPVCHVSAHEADAFARWAGARLPSEHEWEAAARSRGSGSSGALDQLDFAPARCVRNGADPQLERMTGDVWEWTASGLAGYPGFRAFPYREYAEVFFGGPYRVLRGGSWATQPHAARVSFRNWDLPVRRQIFSGVRLAWDAA